MMTVKPFDRENHYHILKEWWAHWDHPILPLEYLPETGFMVLWESKPIFCAFLILTNAMFAFVDMACASPETSYEDREVAIIRLAEVMEGCAKELGFKQLVVLSHKERLTQKVESAGFVTSPQTYLSRKVL